MFNAGNMACLLYTSDAADDMQCVDLGGRRIIKKKWNMLKIELFGHIYLNTSTKHSEGAYKR